MRGMIDEIRQSVGQVVQPFVDALKALRAISTDPA